MIRGRCSIHAIDQASRTHVGPILVDVIKAGLTGIRLVNARPAGWDFDKDGPERILALVINQHDIGAVFIFERICHSSGLSVCGCFDWVVSFLKFDCEGLTYLSYRAGLSQVWVATGDLANCDLSADIGSPSVGWGARGYLRLQRKIRHRHRTFRERSCLQGERCSRRFLGSRQGTGLRGWSKHCPFGGAVL